jgi:hypothetical protein
MALSKLTKATLLARMDEKIQNLNLLKAALLAETHIKQADLMAYKSKFEAELKPSGKK